MIRFPGSKQDQKQSGIKSKSKYNIRRKSRPRVPSPGSNKLMNSSSSRRVIPSTQGIYLMHNIGSKRKKQKSSDFQHHTLYSCSPSILSYSGAKHHLIKTHPSLPRRPAPLLGQHNMTLLKAITTTTHLTGRPPLHYPLGPFVSSHPEDRTSSIVPSRPGLPPSDVSSRSLSPPIHRKISYK